VSAPTLRAARTDDAAKLHEIYSHYVRTGFGTFEEMPPGVPAFEEKLRTIAANGLPWLVAEADGDIAGYVYASPFRPRTGYRYCVEDSVYVRADQCRRGIGLELLRALVAQCESAGIRQIVAVIGDSQNLGSIRAHERAGFAHAGVLKGIGFKLGRWIDVVLMQRALNGGATTAPQGRGWR
jgi:phosphinothricin acetyltransferase